MLVWPRKVEGLRRLVASLPQVAETFPRLRLLVVGDGRMRPTVEREVNRLHISDLVRFVGAVGDPVPYLNLADIACHISFHDSFAQAVLEAMAMDKPVVVSDSFDLPEPLDDWGLVRTQANPGSISASILGLAADEARRRDPGARARQRARAEFSWTSTAKHFWRLYGMETEELSPSHA